MKKLFAAIGLKFAGTFNLVCFAITLLAIGVFSVASSAQDVPVESFVQQVFDLIGSFGGLPWMAKIAGVITVIISSMKVSFIRPLWDKLGEAKVWLAPILGLVAGVMGMGVDITWASAIAYVTAGAGAVIFHELLDTIKAIPGLGSMWVSVIDFISIILRAPQPAFGSQKKL